MKNSRSVQARSVQGFTIIELMVALALGIMMSAATLQIFLNTRNISSTETAMSQVQETGRFGLHELVKDIRMVGYQGCADPNDIDLTIIADDLQGAEYINGPLRGFEVAANGTFSPALAVGDSLLSIQTGGAGPRFAIPGSDVISIQYANTIDAELTEPTTTSSNVKIDSNPLGLAQDDYALISDCKSAHIFEITNAAAGTGTEMTFTHANSSNTTNKLLPGYDAGAKLMQFEHRVYFVADTGRDTDAGQDITALYMKEFNRPPQELLQGVESLHVLYGQLLANGNVRYVSADDASLNMNDVVSLRVGILVQSYELVASDNDTKSYNLPGSVVSNSGTGAHAGDRTLRKPFVETVRIRNKRIATL